MADPMREELPPVPAPVSARATGADAVPMAGLSRPLAGQVAASPAALPGNTPGKPQRRMRVAMGMGGMFGGGTAAAMLAAGRR